MGDVLRPIAMLAANLAPEHDVDHVFVSIDPEDETPGVQAPEAAIREATTNLVDNALKYCCSGSAATAGDEAAARRSLAIGCDWNPERSMVLIEVWNSCPSLDADELVSVLEWGVRGGAADRVDGSGVGLPIASQLVALLGGRLELCNAPMPLWAQEQERVRYEGVEDAGRVTREGTTGVSARIWLPRARRSDAPLHP